MMDGASEVGCCCCCWKFGRPCEGAMCPISGHCFCAFFGATSSVWYLFHSLQYIYIWGLCIVATYLFATAVTHALDLSIRRPGSWRLGIWCHSIFPRWFLKRRRKAARCQRTRRNPRVWCWRWKKVLVCDALALVMQMKSAQTLNLQEKAAMPLNLQRTIWGLGMLEDFRGAVVIFKWHDGRGRYVPAEWADEWAFYLNCICLKCIVTLSVHAEILSYI